jgi:hypothetical protein
LINEISKIAPGAVGAVQRERRVAPRHAAGITKENNVMNLTVLHIGPLVALIAGILILIVPRLLNYIIAIYLIIVGIVGLFGTRL